MVKLAFNKQWYLSKTVWCAGASLVVGILSAMFGDTSWLVAVVVGALSGGGIYIRVKATEKLTK